MMNYEKSKLEPAAKWISYPYNPFFDMSKSWPAPYFRKTFQLKQAVKSASVKICGLGYCELHVNGKKAGDEVLNPPFTRYDVSALYYSYDITAMLTEGENVIGAIVGNGMYNMFAKNAWDFEKAPWRDHPKLMAEVRIIMEDGNELLIAGDTTWKTSFGPIISDNLYEGEIYDARNELPGWDRPGYDDKGWLQANICRGPGGMLKPMEMEPCRIIHRIKPASFREVRPGTWIYDMGINMTGWVSLKVKGQAGTAVTLKFAEKLTPEGDIDPSNINIFATPEKFQTDIYTLNGQGDEIWEPRFTYHGFQYVQMSGYPGVPGLDSIEGCVVHTDLSDKGSFECSNELLNKIQTAARLSTLGNYHGIPTDCPHREKNGWTGDAVLSAEQVLYNFEPVLAYRKWLNDIKDCQRPNGQLPGIAPSGGWGYGWGNGPAWDSALVMIPWYIYVYRGDKSIIEEMYDSIIKYVDYLTTMSDGYIVNFGLGDWCPPEGGPGGFKCPAKVTDTAIYFKCSDILSKISEILGHKDTAEVYDKLKRNIYNAFNCEFVNNDTGEVTGNCQTSYACALYFDLVKGGVREKVRENLVKEVEKSGNHIDCGILGTKYIMQVLTDMGRCDLAYAIATQTTFPGWGWWMEQGATTLWETWNGDSSRNHHMFSDISAWFYKALAGINPDPENPGYRHIIIKPNSVDGLEWVKASHKSTHGLIECSWFKTSCPAGSAITKGSAAAEIYISDMPEGTLKLNVTIPEKCSATVYLPNNNRRGFYINGETAGTCKGIGSQSWEDGFSLVEIESGSYEFCI